MTRTIAGLFPDGESAERAIVDLKNAGFGPDRIGVVLRDSREAAEITEGHETAATEGAVAGGLIGITAGAVLAATGTLVIPGIGPFLSAGILATSLVGGAAGWLVGALVGLGIPKDEAQYYEDRVQQGSALVTVDAGDREHEARTILRGNGAEILENRYVSDSTDTDAFVKRDHDVPLKGEGAVPQKRAYDDEEVLLHKDAVTKNEQAGDPERRERVTVDGVGDNDAV